MSAKVLHELCRKCIVRKTCDYVPTSGRLIRCLDRRTSGELKQKEYPEDTPVSEELAAAAQTVD